MIKDTSGQDIQVSNSKPKKIKWLLGCAVGVLVVLASASAFVSHDANISVSRDRIQIAVVEKGTLVRDIAATGQIVAANAPQIYSPEQGYVDLLVKAGDTVTKGQLLAKVDSPTLNNRLQQEQAELERLDGEFGRKQLDVRRENLALSKTLDLANVELQAAKRENRRAQLSIKKNLISQIDLEKAQDDLARAELNYEHAQKEVSLGKDTLAFELRSVENQLERQRLVVAELQRQVSNLEIIAPVSGIVGNLLIEPNALVNANQSLMKLVDLSAYEAELQVPESYAAELGLGMSVRLEIGSKKVAGTLSAISPEVHNREVTTRVRFEHSDIDGIRQNQRLSARIFLENKENVLKVRRGSFINDGGFVAYKVNGDIAHRIDIATGASSTAEVEVVSGLEPGDQIIISSYEAFNREQSVLIR
ncbi:efflux RND transporter periplasmic adaptor subunit (plasmid) [Pseudoalteromonas sp. T1lg65]|uniref:efflux RND transporter periplasmic adaptor subunit n=1 Tax=Pseudoalteromonas sp. T1lg65 TaxID=2077101 RepID=UPI003F7AD2D2